MARLKNWPKKEVFFHLAMMTTLIDTQRFWVLTEECKDLLDKKSTIGQVSISVFIIAKWKKTSIFSQFSSRATGYQHPVLKNQKDQFWTASFPTTGGSCIHYLLINIMSSITRHPLASYLLHPTLSVTSIILQNKPEVLYIIPPKSPVGTTYFRMSGPCGP